MDRRLRPAAPDGREAGFALLSVILFLLAVAALLAPFALAARSGLDRAGGVYRRDRLDLLADGLVTVLARDLARSSGLAEGGPPAGTALCAAGGYAVAARIQDQRGLVDLNTAGAELLIAGFRALGAEPRLAEPLAQAVLVYRDAGDDPEPLPGEVAVADGPKHAAFEAIEELQDFAPLRDIPAERLAGIFTLRSGRSAILGPAMPAALAQVLPAQPEPAFPFVAATPAGRSVFRVEVWVRAAQDDTLGRAGILVALPGGAAGSFVVESRADPASWPGAALSAAPDAAACDAVFGPPVAAVLRAAES